MRSKKTKSNIIHLTQGDAHMLMVLLHELAHVMTPYIERKVKGEWIRIDHSNVFYENFYKLTQCVLKRRMNGTAVLYLGVSLN